MQQLIHYTLSTGKTGESKRISQEAINRLRPLAAAGGAIPDRLSFVVAVTHGSDSAMFSVSYGQDPVATCGVAWTDAGASKVWPIIEKQYLDVSDLLMQMPVNHELGGLVSAVAEKPASLPWLGIVSYPMKATGTPPDISWLPEFELSIAWTILANRAEQAGLSNEDCNELYEEAHRAGAAGKLDAAASILQRLVAHRPNDNEYALGLGRVLRELGKNEEAMASLLRAEQLNPHNRMTQCELGAVLVTMERFADAETRFRKVLSVPVKSIDHPLMTACAQNGLAACIVKLYGATAEAEDLLRKALTVLSGDAAMWFRLTEVCAGLGKDAEARKALAKVVELTPGTALAEYAERLLANQA